MLYPLDVELW